MTSSKYELNLTLFKEGTANKFHLIVKNVENIRFRLELRRTTMNATKAYLDACRYLVGADVDDPSGWVEIQRLLSGVRLALTCCVCGRLLRRPLGPSPSVCHHHVCRECVGGKMRYIKRGCGWCKDFEGFVPNGQLECVVRCFGRLCRYLQRRVERVLSSLAVDTTVGGALTIIQEAAALDEGDDGMAGEMESSAKESESVQKKVAVSQWNSGRRRNRKRMKISNNCDDNESDNEICFNYKKAKSIPSSSVNAGVGNLPNGQSVNLFTAREGCKSNCHVAERGRFLEMKTYGDGCLAFVADSSHDNHSELDEFDSGCEKKTENLILAEHDYNKCTADQTEGNTDDSSWTPEMEQQVVKRPTYSREQTEICRRPKTSNREFVADASVSSSVVSSTVVGTGSDAGGGLCRASDSAGRRFKGKGKSGCRCALATPNPGKLTCCGQRCPCYAAFKGCDSCKCRGCRNPRGDPKNIPASLMHTAAAPRTQTSTPHGSLSKTSAANVS